MALTASPGPKASVLPHGLHRRNVSLWFGLLAGPFATLVDVGVGEAYVEHAEGASRLAWLLGLAALTALVCIGAGALAWVTGKRAEDPDETAQERVRFMATAGVIASAFSLLVVLALLVPKLILPGGAST
jgi:hypothetical protein